MWFAALVAVSLAAPPGSPRPAHDWSQWGVGTRATFRVTLPGPDGPVEGAYVRVLAGRVLDAYTIEETMSLGGGRQVQRTEWRVPEVIGEGAPEGITRPGCCAIWRATGRRDETLVETRAWVERDGQLAVKMLQLVGGRQEGRWSAVAFDEAITVPAGEFRCWRVEGEVDTGNGARAVKSWLNSDVPGGVVRTELAADAEGGAMVFELVSFGTGG